MTNIPYLIAGHSNMFCLGAPAASEDRPHVAQSADKRGAFVVAPWSATHGRLPEYWDELVKSATGQNVLLVWFGNQYSTGFLLEAEQPFDFYDEAMPDMAEGAVIIPRAMVHAFFAPTLAELPALFQRLKDNGAASVKLLGTPPPKADLHNFDKFIREYPAVINYARQRNMDLNETRLSSPRLLLKLWRVLQSDMAEIAAKSGVEFVSVPASTMDDEGFLAPGLYDYAPHGVSHGNFKYGTLMLEAALNHKAAA